MPVEGVRRPAWAEISTSALAHNVGELRRVLGPTALCAVVKANGYGHGAPLAARAVLDGGADSLAVAIVDEGIELREAGVDAPILLLAEVPAATMTDALAAGLTLTVGSAEGARAAVAAAEALGGRHRVHVKVDTGMHRMGVAPEDVAGGRSASWRRAPRSTSRAPTRTSAWPTATPTTTARSPAPSWAPSTRRSRASARRRRGSPTPPTARERWPTPSRAGRWCASAWPSTATCRAPGPARRPAGSTWRRRSPCAPGSSRRVGRSRASGRATGAGAPWRATRRVATVPFGYADGYPRRLFDAGAEVLIRGRRFPLAGAVTMDQLLVDCGDDEVRPGDEVVLLGRQGGEVVSAEEWAARAGTISWEILCGVGARVPRAVVA